MEIKTEKGNSQDTNLGLALHGGKPWLTCVLTAAQRDYVAAPTAPMEVMSGYFLRQHPNSLSTQNLNSHQSAADQSIKDSC